MPVHDVEEDPAGGGELQDGVSGRERVVQHRDFLQVEDQAVLVDDAFRGPGRPRRVADHERVREGDAGVGGVAGVARPGREAGGGGEEFGHGFVGVIGGGGGEGDDVGVGFGVEAGHDGVDFGEEGRLSAFVGGVRVGEEDLGRHLAESGNAAFCSEIWADAGEDCADGGRAEEQHDGVDRVADECRDHIAVLDLLSS